MKGKTHIAPTTSRYTLCKWARWVIEDMGHRVVSTTYYRECSPAARAELTNVCRECHRLSSQGG